MVLVLFDMRVAGAPRSPPPAGGRRTGDQVGADAVMVGSQQVQGAALGVASSSGGALAAWRHPAAGNSSGPQALEVAGRHQHLVDLLAAVHVEYVAHGAVRVVGGHLQDVLIRARIGSRWWLSEELREKPSISRGCTSASSSSTVAKDTALLGQPVIELGIFQVKFVAQDPDHRQFSGGRCGAPPAT